MLNRVREPFSKIECQTNYSNLSIEELYRIILPSDSRNIELILRAMNGEKKLEQEALSICDTILRSTEHNFCYLARAMLGSPNTEQDLLLACRTKTPYDQKFSAQAGYQLARYYFSIDKYIESQAWLAYSIINGYTKAETDFLWRGCAKGSKFVNTTSEKKLFELTHPGENFKELSLLERFTTDIDYSSCQSILSTMVTIIILSGKKFSQLKFLRVHENSTWYRNTDITGISWMTVRFFYLLPHISNTVYPADALQNVDTLLHEIAENALAKNAVLFFELMTYCVNNNIISLDIYQNVIQFLTIYSTHPNKLMLQKCGEEVIFNLTPQAPAIASPNTYFYLMSQLEPGSTQPQFIETPITPTNIIVNTPQLQPVYQEPPAKEKRNFINKTNPK